MLIIVGSSKLIRILSRMDVALLNLFLKLVCTYFVFFELNLLAGVKGGPFCDQSGCTFLQESYYEGALPKLLGSTWTITVWATFSHSNNETLITMLVRRGVIHRMHNEL